MVQRKEWVNGRYQGHCELRRLTLAALRDQCIEFYEWAEVDPHPGGGGGGCSACWVAPLC